MATMPESLAPGSVPPGEIAIRRFLESSLCVLAWVALGWLLHMDGNLYLVLGVPITLLFQLLVRRRPIRAMWVASAPPFRIGRIGLAIGIALALVPLLGAGVAMLGRDWAGCGWCLSAVWGAFAGAYATRQFHTSMIRPLLLCLLVNSLIDAATWTVLLRSGVTSLSPEAANPGERAVTGLTSLIVYFPGMFILEEVFFRGVLDAHTHRPDEGLGWLSALFVAALWGLWHLPIVGDWNLATVGLLLFVHCPFGMVLSRYWRQTGNLTVPVLSHAFSDAVRNALFGAS